MIGSWEVQLAIVAALKAANVVGKRIYDHVPQDSTGRVTVEFPYVEIGETQPIKADVQGRQGVDEYRTLHIWSRYRGDKEILQIGAAIEAALHAVNLAAEGRATIFATLRDMRTLQDPDGLTQHGVMTVRVQHFGLQET